MKLTPTFNFGRPYRSIWSFILTLILVFGLFQGFLPKNALATNSYFDDVIFYKDSNGYYRLGIHIKTSLSGTMFQCNFPDPHCRLYADFEVLPSYYPPTKTEGHFAVSYTTDCSGTYTLTAGNTYELFLTLDPASYPNINDTHYIDYITFWNDWPNFTDNENYYFLETPTLTITYPEDDYEIAENFYITGSFTQPASQYQYLTMFMSAVGGESYIDVFSQTISGASSGTISIWVNGVPAGYYDFDIYMRDNESNFYPQGGWPITNIHIVNDLPFTLPPYGGQPPTTAPPVFQPLEPANYYTENSEYSTSTALYNTLTGTFAPVILAIGDSLTNLAQNFTQSNASSTGNQLGQSILLVRSYLTNINAFFANFPVGQFLLLYLIALVVVIVLRLVKGLIGLFKI